MTIIELILNTVAPTRCVICGIEGAGLCQACEPDLTEAIPERCFLCHKLGVNYLTCRNCRAQAPITNVFVLSEYAGHMKVAIRQFKFARGRHLSKPLGYLMAQIISARQRPDYVTYVPTVPSRVRRRGFDHSKLLAQQVARELGIACVPYLRRVGSTRQLGAKRQTRQQQIKGAFVPINTQIFTDKRVLLVDDVTTTGSTLIEAARTLKSAGAKRIIAAVLAQRS